MNSSNIQNTPAREGAPPIYGLVLTGGKSSRMKKDKAALQYHGESQAEICYKLLTDHCEKVFISTRKEQGFDTCQKSLPQLHDVYSGVGPLGGILTAFQAHANVAWLVLACDLPFVEHATIAYLIENRDPRKLATAFLSSTDDLPEPLCAIYEPDSIEQLNAFHFRGCNCPRKILINSDVHLLKQENENSLVNVNSPQEYEDARRSLESGK
jgi:molybdopterin-guanine dinucleotide biosynthesis protein A